MEPQVLRPITQELDMKGRISYSDPNQAWNTIRFKKEVVNEFYQLKEKSSKFSYKLTYYRTYEELEKAIKDMNKKGIILPLLLFMYKNVDN